jgi:metal-responsive CopG/Arc/MetJ family transcriptional regulator
MHMHDNADMRTTIELKDEHRAALLEIAARRRLKGFSALVEDAVESYLKADADMRTRQRNALALKGTPSRAEGERLRKKATALRRSWR